MLHFIYDNVRLSGGLPLWSSAILWYHPKQRTTGAPAVTDYGTFAGYWHFNDPKRMNNPKNYTLALSHAGTFIGLAVRIAERKGWPIIIYEGSLTMGGQAFEIGRSADGRRLGVLWREVDNQGGSHADPLDRPREGASGTARGEDARG